MAFELPALPNFQPNIPQPASPIDTYGKLLQLKMLSGQQQLLPIQIQREQQAEKAAELQNQITQNELASTEAMKKAWSNPDTLKSVTGTPEADQNGLGFDPNALTSSLVKQGVLPQQAMAMANQFIERAKNIAEVYKTQGQGGEAQQNIRAKTLGEVANKLGSIGDLPTEKAIGALDSFKQDLVKNPKAYPGLTQQELSELYSMDLGHLPAAEQLLGLEGKIADFHKAKAEATTAQQKIINPETGMSPEQVSEANKQLAVETNPRNVAAKAQIAAAEGRARANVEMEVARGSNAALAQVPPHMVQQATADAVKAGTEFAQAKSVSDRLAAMLADAKKGNVVSYQLIPQEGALQVTTSQGVHRINMAEIQNYGGGSIFQRLEGHLGKALTGKSIPDSVLNDMEEMQKVQLEGAQSKYENSLKTINDAYGAKFKPVEMDTMGEDKSGKITGNTVVDNLLKKHNIVH